MSTADQQRFGDAEARREIAEDLDRMLFVEAGAGSGKTSALVGRIVQLVATGRAALGEVAAITFTEAAAAELRGRVRSELAKVAASAPSGPDDVRSRAEAGLTQVDEAMIGTIHGFCQRILAEHPLEAGLPPGFAVLDEVQAILDWRGRWAASLDRLLEEPGTRDVVGAAWLLGMEAGSLESIAAVLDEQWDRCTVAAPSPATTIEAVRAAAMAGVAAVVEHLSAAIGSAGDCADDSDKLAERLRLLEPYLRRAERAGDWIDQLRFLGREPRGPSLKVGNVGKQSNWPDIAAVRALVQQADQARIEAVAIAGDAILRGVLGRLEAFALGDADDRRRRGELRYHDLLVRARDLVATNGAVRDELRRRYRYVFVDEFQDTDPLQLELVELLGDDSGAAADGAVAGRLFFVGDPKQAIYRFRGADIGVYLATRERLAGGGATLLTTSFRSVPGIIDFVNDVFSSLLADDFEPLGAARSAAPGGPPVRIGGGPMGDGAKVLALDRRRAEAGHIASVIEAATTGVGWSVEDRSAPGGTRRAVLSDVAVLVPRRTGLEVLEGALDEAGIAYRLESATLIFGAQEVRDLLQLARAIDDPGDELALVAALRSATFGCGDDDLLAYRLAGGRWSLEGAAPAALVDSPVSRAIAELSGWRRDRHEIGPVAVLERAIEHRRLLQLATASRDPAESWRRLRFVVEQARAFAEAGGGGLSAFADWVEEQVAGNVRAVESTVPDVGDDAVRIMTIHGAKGLEFPITIVAGLGSSRRGAPSTSAQVLRDGAGAAEVRLRGDRQTSGFENLRQIEEQLELAEELRLLYVATTRARDHLVVCTHHVPSTSGAPSLGQLFHEAASEVPERWRWLDDELADLGATGHPRQGAEELRARNDPRGSEAARPGSASRPGVTEAEYDRWLDTRATLLRRVGRGESVSATAVPRLAAAAVADAAGAGHAPPISPPAPAASVDDELPPWRRGRAGTEVGRAVHAVLQSVELAPFGRDEPLAAAEAAALLEPIAQAQARAERISERADEVARYAAAALASPTVRAAIRSGSARRELFVATRVGDRLLEGFVDLCYEEEGELVVVDYKTDAVHDDAGVEAALARYELQAAAYALALGRATGRRVRRCVLMFLRVPGQPVERDLADLAQLVAEVERLVSADD